jgi:hypothetical protein
MKFLSTFEENLKNNRLQMEVEFMQLRILPNSLFIIFLLSEFLVRNKPISGSEMNPPTSLKT